MRGESLLRADVVSKASIDISTWIEEDLKEQIDTPTTPDFEKLELQTKQNALKTFKSNPMWMSNFMSNE